MKESSNLISHGTTGIIVWQVLFVVVVVVVVVVVLLLLSRLSTSLQASFYFVEWLLASTMLQHLRDK